MNIEFKGELDIQDLRRMRVKILWLLFDFVDYCKKNELPCLITSLMEDVPNRKSLTHKEGRSFDASCRGWNIYDIDEFLTHFNNKWSKVGTAPRGKEPKAVICHSSLSKDGETVSPNHFHFQIRRGV